MKYGYLFFIASTLTSVAAQSVDSLSIKQVDSLIKVSRELTAQRDFEKALEVSAVTEKLALEKFGWVSAPYGSYCFNRGRVNYYKGDMQEAEKWYQESKAIREKVLGKEHIDYAWSLNNLAILYMDMGNYGKAEPLFLESKAIREKVLGKEHPDYAASLNNLANLFRYMGKYEKAEQLYLESSAIREKVLGKEHPDYAQSLNNLAALYWHMGKYEKAEPQYLECKAIWEKVLGMEHPGYALCLNNLAGLYWSMGNYGKAEPLFLESKAIREKVLGKEHPDYAASLNNLAATYNVLGNNEKAEPLYLESKAISEKVLGKEHLDYAASLSNLAILYKNMGNYEKAEPLFLETKGIYEKTMGLEHPGYAQALNNLANIYFYLGKYEKTEPLYLESKAIRENVLGKEHPDYTSSLEDLVDLYERQSRFSVSAPLLAEKFALDQARLSKAITFLSERELASYMATFQTQGNNLGAYILVRLGQRATGAEVGEHGILPALAFDHALFYKGFLLTAATQINTLTKQSPETKEISLNLKSYRRRLAAEYAKPIAERKNVTELEEKANTSEKELAQAVVGYAETKRQVKWKEVMATLKKEEAAIEFVSFKVNFPRKTDSIIYAAMLLKPGTKQPEFIPLFEEKSLDSLLHSKLERKADYVNNLYTIADRGAVAIEAPKKSLYEILWKPLEKELTGIKKIYFSPTGLLLRINLDAMPISETETLADKYQLIELNSTRQLVITNQIKIANNEAMLFGGIQFEQDSLTAINEPIFASKSRGELSFNYIDSTLRGGSWNYLAGTEREVNSIEKIMQVAGVKTTLKKGYSASEESFKNIGTNNNPSHRILHIATHGYFFTDPKESHQSSVISRQEETVFKISDHPMLRSGLILAGGNAAWQGKQTMEGKEDGILTAYEISQMNLSNTELVVLSACETGLGDIQGNEGVYGLQRAFKIAGAKYLIMSLWQVPDKQTSLLMTTFYKKWLTDKMTIPDAFHAAQKELRDLGLDPYQWAGFVLVE
ncbi:MAG: tetratricopeptide repeat protein [Saprospiraceae bacterium]|nr:tetratricopeptide repeat protein [Candidatus Defluviibacterium haderslevense]